MTPCGALRQDRAEEGDQGREDVRQRMNRVGNHGAGLAVDAGKQFKRRQQDVSENADAGQFFYDFLFIHVIAS